MAAGLSVSPSACYSGDSATQSKQGDKIATTEAIGKSSPGLRLLTRAQYRESVKALLGVDVEVSRIPRERISAGHGQIAGVQSVDYDGADAFYELAATVAETALSNVQCGAADTACYVNYANGFLRRAFRGSAEEATLQFYRGLLDKADAGETLSTRLATLIASALSSPYFLYRQEIGAKPHPTRVGVRLASDTSPLTRDLMNRYLRQRKPRNSKTPMSVSASWTACSPQPPPQAFVAL
jgi:Protein of unknown function (DUF1587)/Protein of unknown function (DUF1595)